VSPRRLSAKKRDEILKAAAETFRKVGFVAATMDDIADRARVSKRTVYNHFSSKDVLFDVVTDELWGKLQEAPPAAPPRADSVEERLFALARERLDALLDQQLIALFRAVLAESVRAPELSRAYFGYRDGLLGLDELLRDEIRRGRLRMEHPEIAAAQLWGMVLNPLFWPVVLALRAAPDDTERDIYVREAVATFVARYSKRGKR
jgi:TetR/AcrR family transcriptional regulator of autoinduction and epiphytic fitness